MSKTPDPSLGVHRVVLRSWCRCEARRNRGDHCQLCMGRTCWNKTYEHDGSVYHLVDAVLLWATGSYDGPLSGIAVHKGFACYAKSYTQYRHRTFWLYPLRDSEWKAELIHRASWIQARGEEFKGIVPPDRSPYMKRKPLGFFRIDYKDEPLGVNRIGDEWRQKRYEHFFAEDA